MNLVELNLMEFWQEREKREAPFRETWEAVLRQARRKDPLVRQALDRANKNCLSLLEPTPSPLKYLRFTEATEWQIFYAFLLERFIRTDSKLDRTGWKYISKFIDPVRVELLKKLTLPAVKANEWLKVADNAAQMIVTDWRRDIPIGDKYYLIAQQAERFGQKLAEIRRK